MKQWYEHRHQYPELLKQAVYGLPELHREKIKKASLIANPGCYPTSAILGLAPLMKNRAMVDLAEHHHRFQVGSVTAQAEVRRLRYHYPEVNEGLMAYKIGTHRHTPEIEQELSALAGQPVTVSFTPHLIPMNRGILTTIYARLMRQHGHDARSMRCYQEFYQV